MKMFTLVLGASVFLFNFTADVESRQGGKNVYVPKDYKTIKEALDNSDAGDKIYIAEGDYEEPSGLRLKDGFDLYGEGADKTKITLGGVGAILTGNNIVKGIGFKLKAGSVYLHSADNITLQNCLMQGMGGAGNGLFIEKSRKVNAINCSIVNFGTGIFVRYPPVDILVKNCIISSNRLFGILVSVGEKEGVYFSNITGKPTEPEKSKKGSSGIKIVSEYNDVWGSSRNYCNISAGGSDISKDPKFVSENDCHLQTGSPCIDAGDPDPKYNDQDGSRNDIGAFPYGAKNK